MKNKTFVLLLRITAIVLLMINAVSALAAGYSFITDPSGAGLGMTTDYLRFSPFDNFLAPGITLFIANGVLSLAIFVVILFKVRYYPVAIAMQGAILSGWIIIQLFMVRFFHPLHLIMLGIGFALLAIGWLLYKRECGVMPETKPAR